MRLGSICKVQRDGVEYHWPGKTTLWSRNTKSNALLTIFYRDWQPGDAYDYSPINQQGCPSEARRARGRVNSLSPAMSSNFFGVSKQLKRMRRGKRRYSEEPRGVGLLGIGTMPTRLSPLGIRWPFQACTPNSHAYKICRIFCKKGSSDL